MRVYLLGPPSRGHQQGRAAIWAFGAGLPRILLQLRFRVLAAHMVLLCMIGEKPTLKLLKHLRWVMAPACPPVLHLEPFACTYDYAKLQNDAQSVPTGAASS